ncbi:hypothetical protein J2W49_004842 [Hydrogenophaga palleronii]|uniref:Quinohemoprotein amine dehydrogenase alpha subunit haem binding domain-containing protein n=1 Tax=Hydrogenophaga palleronii TaxID=65655 RepID=A0ABU1WUL3_9BURK|nr:hypothetical protein [Hydrogenophaga palleronii]MDR7152864.1 hypothetical protein [Hydrogenophaga palleronii]
MGVAAFGRALGPLALLTVLALPAHAEMSGDDYRSPTVLSSPQERAKVAEELEADRLRLSREAEQQQESQARALALQRQREQQRPLGERLLDAKCTRCHSLDIVRSQSKSALGWRWTVERMRWWHGAALEKGEAGVIARQLVQTRGAARSSIWFLAGAGAAGVGVLFFGIRRFQGRRVSAENHAKFNTKGI